MLKLECLIVLLFMSNVITSANGIFCNDFWMRVTEGDLPLHSIPAPFVVIPKSFCEEGSAIKAIPERQASQDQLSQSVER